MKSKQVLDVQQMQHLQELGMKMDYDTLYRYVKFEDTDWLLKPFSDLNIIGISCKYIPAYTLQDVLDALPKQIGVEYIYDLCIFPNEDISYTQFIGGEINDNLFEVPINGNLIDAAYEMLCLCIENGCAKIGKEASDERADR